MVSRLDPVDVLDVAIQLHSDHSELGEPEWADSSDARYRSAVSRAYYAAFLFLKDRLEKNASWPQGFPRDNVHHRVIRALATALSPNHFIPSKLKALLEERVRADYDLTVSMDRPFAEDRCDESDELIERIGKLAPSKLSDIANRIQQ